MQLLGIFRALTAVETLPAHACGELEAFVVLLAAHLTHAHDFFVVDVRQRGRTRPIGQLDQVDDLSGIQPPRGILIAGYGESVAFEESVVQSKNHLTSSQRGRQRLCAVVRLFSRAFLFIPAFPKF